MKLFIGWILFLPLLVTKYANTDPGPEQFINVVLPIVTGETNEKYYLEENASACSFRKFDYDEWVKYGLVEPVPFYILNELAESCSKSTASYRWKTDQLTGAICLDQKGAAALLSKWTHTLAKHNSRLPQKAIFYFSTPAFTADGQYAVLDMGLRCDDRECGMGATYIFRMENGQWKVVGKRLAWGS